MAITKADEAFFASEGQAQKVSADKAYANFVRNFQLDLESLQALVQYLENFVSHNPKLVEYRKSHLNINKDNYTVKRFMYGRHFVFRYPTIVLNGIFVADDELIISTDTFSFNKTIYLNPNTNRYEELGTSFKNLEAYVERVFDGLPDVYVYDARVKGSRYPTITARDGFDPIASDVKFNISLKDGKVIDPQVNSIKVYPLYKYQVNAMKDVMVIADKVVYRTLTTQYDEGLFVNGTYVFKERGNTLVLDFEVYGNTFHVVVEQGNSYAYSDVLPNNVIGMFEEDVKVLLNAYNELSRKVKKNVLDGLNEGIESLDFAPYRSRIRVHGTKGSRIVFKEDK